VKVPLGSLAHVRASRCAAGTSLAVLAWGQAEYAILARELTVERLRAFLGPDAQPQIECHRLPRLDCLIFVLAGASGDPGSLLRLDPGRQLLSGRLLQLEIDKEPELL
jgi:hypothetical protein